jgi:hypothetical protein
MDHMGERWAARKNEQDCAWDIITDDTNDSDFFYIASTLGTLPGDPTGELTARAIVKAHNDGLAAITQPARKFELVRDGQGFAQAIAVDGWFILHIERGTVRNEANADKLVAVLNAAVAVVSSNGSAEADALHKALVAVMPDVAGAFVGK